MFEPYLERALTDAATRHGLRLLLLFGSRARRESHAMSDWDFGYLPGTSTDPDALAADLVRLLRSDRVDVVDLSRASGLLRYRAARDGRVVYARDDRVFPDFWFDAVSFWCDMEPVLKRGYAAVLVGLDP